MYTSYVIISLVCAIACFLIAKEKGWNPMKWFFGGLIFSGLAILVIIMIRKKR